MLTHLPKQKMKTAKEIISELPLHINDAARLILEVTEELGELAKSCSRHELITLLRRALRQGASSVLAEEHSVSFYEAAWSSIKARSYRRPTTLRDLRNYVRRMLKVNNIGEKTIRSMDSNLCREILQQAFGNSSHSYTKGRAILHSIFAYGKRQGWCSENPVEQTETRKAVEKEIHPLKSEEIERLKAAVEHTEHRCMKLSLHLLLYCGLRPNEVSRMSSHHIQWEHRRVIVTAQSSKTGGGRTVPLRRIKDLKKEDICIPRNWLNRWKALRRAAGFRANQWIPDICRHTFASYHAAKFRNLPELQLEMGHRSVHLLRSRYLNLPKLGDIQQFWKT